MKLEEKEFDKFEALAEKFRHKLVCLLKDNLANSKLTEKEKKDICGNFLAELTTDLDFGESQVNNEYYRPVVAFLSGNNLSMWNDETKLITPYQAFQHHELVWEEIDEFYDSNVQV